MHRIILLLFCAIAALPGVAAECAIEAEDSRVLIMVYKTGMLSGLGHNHVMSSDSLEGTLRVDEAQKENSSFHITLPIKELEVDEPAARRQAGPKFSGEVSPQSRESTYRNMLSPRVLDAERYPEIVVRSVKFLTGGSTPLVKVRVSMHGVERIHHVPLNIERMDRRVFASGRFALRQSDYGIKPLSFLFGALAVKDRIDIQFDVTADCST